MYSEKTPSARTSPNHAPSVSDWYVWIAGVLWDCIHGCRQTQGCPRRCLCQPRLKTVLRHLQHHQVAMSAWRYLQGATSSTAPIGLQALQRNCSMRKFCVVSCLFATSRVGRIPPRPLWKSTHPVQIVPTGRCGPIFGRHRGRQDLKTQEKREVSLCHQNV